MLKALVKAVLLRLVFLLALPGCAFRKPPTPTRSLWTGAPIINMAINARAERLLGVRADSLVFETYFITRAFTYDLSSWRRLPLIGSLLPFAVLLWACLKYDRFHFYCDRGILIPHLPFRIDPGELRLLKRLRKQLFFWTYGADVRTTGRTRALGRHHCCLHCPAPGLACICDDDRGRQAYALVKRYALALFSMGDMIEYAPDSVTDLFFWPVDLDADRGRRYQPRFPDADPDRPLRIVHASNHRHFKGTDYLVAAVERLRADALPVELTLVERTPNIDALEIYRAADVIFDQCLIGFHGFLAHEAMALGKPVMAFIRKPRLYLLHPDECPILNAPPDRIEPVIRDLLADRSQLRALGERGRRYIERYHTPSAFARRLRHHYQRLGVESP